jgi:hypothetical protein
MKVVEDEVGWPLTRGRGTKSVIADKIDRCTWRSEILTNRESCGRKRDDGRSRFLRESLMWQWVSQKWDRTFGRVGRSGERTRSSAGKRRSFPCLPFSPTFLKLLMPPVFWDQEICRQRTVGSRLHDISVFSHALSCTELSVRYRIHSNRLWPFLPHGTFRRMRSEGGSASHFARLWDRLWLCIDETETVCSGWGVSSQLTSQSYCALHSMRFAEMDSVIPGKLVLHRLL